MKIESRILTRIALAACVACVVVSSAEARTVKQKKQAARTQFETAERLREALDGRPESQRTRRDYLKVLDAYRKVYYTAPTSNKAEAAVLAVAELLDEQGRVFNDPKNYKDAIGQLVFLRREYPGSKYRVEALFTIGEIFRDDLNDTVQAKATFEDYLKHYPSSRLAPQAKQALVEMADLERTASAKKRSARLKTPDRSASTRTKAAWASITPTPTPAPEAQAEEKAAPEKASKPVRDRDALTADQGTPADVAADQSSAQPAQDISLNPAPHRMPRLTSVRHWSTPDYTRVAIDLEQEVEYQAGRVPHPDRIFFDLYGTRLASDLVGKSFDVEAGFLHRIRVSQYKTGVARVVLDVDDVAEYSAFLLPNPYRLIIDIHGKLPPQQMASAKPDTPKAAPAKSNDQDTVSDVTVTQPKPSINSKAPVNSKPAEKAVAAPQVSTEKIKPATVGTQQTKPGDTQTKIKASNEKNDKNDKPVEIAKADPPKNIVDDTTIDNPSKLNSKPTSGPTFQAIAPQESSRNKSKKKTPEPAKTTASGHTAAPTANGDRSLIRALGLKI